MYASAETKDELERTAFRKAEKKYKLYYDNTKRKRRPMPVDLSEVIDFNSILESHNQSGELPSGIYALRCEFETPIFCLESHPGFYFIPGALSVDEQCNWIKESLVTFPEPPNRTNHNAIFGPIHKLFSAAKENLILVEEERLLADPESVADPSNKTTNASRWRISEKLNGDTGKSVPATALLRKLRWSTLGLQFDWSKRCYDISLPHKKIPDALSQLVKRMAAPAIPLGEEFRAEAAIVNYFSSGDMLGGHLDDMEKDWSKPIVSMSLGCKAIFLLGGKSREHPPLAMFLRSGDIVLMAGEARQCFHGVPRIFTDEENSEISPLEMQLSSEDDLNFLEYIRTSRININVRQVF